MGLKKNFRLALIIWIPIGRYVWFNHMMAFLKFFNYLTIYQNELNDIFTDYKNDLSVIQPQIDIFRIKSLKNDLNFRFKNWYDSLKFKL